VVIDGSSHAAHPGERLVDLINRVGLKLSQVCYHPQLDQFKPATHVSSKSRPSVRALCDTVSDGMSVQRLLQKPMRLAEAF